MYALFCFFFRLCICVCVESRLKLLECWKYRLIWNDKFIQDPLFTLFVFNLLMMHEWLLQFSFFPSYFPPRSRICSFTNDISSKPCFTYFNGIYFFLLGVPLSVYVCVFNCPNDFMWLKLLRKYSILNEYESAQFEWKDGLYIELGSLSGVLFV